MPVPAVARFAQKVLPASWFADLDRGRPGKIRRVMKRMGPTILASPVRRACQALCFAVFLYSFLFVCWPYDARPAGDGLQSDGWRLSELRDDGTLVWQHVHSSESTALSNWLINRDKPVHLVDDAAEYIGEFELSDAHHDKLILVPVGQLTEAHFDQLLTQTGTWSLHSRRPNSWPSHYADNLHAKEAIPADLFLAIDPLVSLSTAIASRSWVWSLRFAGIILAICVFIPRGFCGYLCPLGTLIDLFDWSVTRRTQRFRVADDGWWVHLKYYILLVTLICAACGVLVSGYVSAIPVLTRGLLFVVEPFQTGAFRGWHQVPVIHAGHLLSIVLFFGVLCLGFFVIDFGANMCAPVARCFHWEICFEQRSERSNQAVSIATSVSKSVRLMRSNPTSRPERPIARSAKHAAVRVRFMRSSLFRAVTSMN